jgi:hypothetical protein
LRIDFPGYTGAQSLEQISWDEFFEKFDNQNLAFVYQETTARGLRSNFNKLIKRRPAEKSQAAVERSKGLGRATRSEPASAAKHARKAGTAPSKSQSAHARSRRSKTGR